MDWSSRQKSNEKIAVLNDKLDQIDLIDIFTVFHPKAAEYTFLSYTHGTFSRKDYTLGHKKNLNKFQKTEITSRLLQLQWYEIRNQYKKKKANTHKQMDAK